MAQVRIPPETEICNNFSEYDKKYYSDKDKNSKDTKNNDKLKDSDKNSEFGRNQEKIKNEKIKDSLNALIFGSELFDNPTLNLSLGTYA